MLKSPKQLPNCVKRAKKRRSRRFYGVLLKFALKMLPFRNVLNMCRVPGDFYLGQ